jgi:molybdopterin converting factor small subunit
VRVWIAQPLRSYVQQRSAVEAFGATLAQLLDDLERRHPGIRFRIIDEQDGIRPHVRIFVNHEAVRRLDVSLRETDEVHVLQSLSGG